MQQFEVIKYQPDFPNEDLDQTNVPFVDFYLRENHEPRSHAHQLRETMRPLHLTAHRALQQCGIELEYSQDEYDAFCDGFADFEYMSLVVNPRYVKEQLVVKNVHLLLTHTGAMPEIELADHRSPWIDIFPNVHSVITDNGVRQGNTMAQLHSRTMGAQIAYELQAAA